MATTLVDQLLVTLKLDPRDFDKGTKKAAADVIALKKTVNDSSKDMNRSVGEAMEGMGSSFAGVVKRAAIIAIIFKAIKGVTDAVLAASRATRELGNNSRAYDIAASRLRNFQNVAEMFGGAAEDVTKTIAGLQKSLFNLTFNGQMSDQLVMLGRLGVQFQDASGHARDFKDVFLDTATAIEQARSQGTMTEGEAFQYLQAAGFDPGLSRAALGGRSAAEAELSRQEQRRQVSGEDIAAANANERAITGAGQAKDAGMVAAQRLASPVITRTAGAFEHIANLASGQEDLTATWEAWKAGIEPATAALGDLADSAGGAASALQGAILRLAGTGRAAYESQIQASAKRHGLDPEILAGLLNTESGFNPNARSAAGAIGVAQFMSATAETRGFAAGRDPNRDIEEAAKYLAELRQHFVKTGADPDAAMDYALMSYNAGERRVRKSDMMTEGGAALSGETTAYPGRVYDYAEAHSAGAASANTTNYIDQINVNTQATDAEGVAGSIGGALNRKLNAAQAEQGMQ